MNVDLKAIPQNPLLERAVKQGMQHKIGLSQWDSRTKFGGPPHVFPKAGHRIKKYWPFYIEKTSEVCWKVTSLESPEKKTESLYFMSHLLPCGGQNLSDIKRTCLFFWSQHMCFPEPQCLVILQSFAVAVLLKKTPNHISSNEQRCFELHP